MATRTSAQHVFMFLWIIGSVAAGDLKAKPGEDVTLQCNSPTGANVTKLVWRRPGLEDDNVFFFRDNKSIESYQDPLYRGRVELKDPEMKNGDASVVLKNVDYDDSGTYECEVTTSSDTRRKREVTAQSTNVTVSKDSGEVRVNAGDDVLLRCNSSTDAAITKIKWERPELDHRSVFFFRDNKSMKSYQDPRYHDRVELKDPEMKNGDVSVLLKNVTVNDSGTYQCWVTTPNMPGKLLHSVHLTVSERLTKEELVVLLVGRQRVITWLGVGFGVVCLLLVGVTCSVLRIFVFPKSQSGIL